MAINCTELNAQYDELTAAIRARVLGKEVVRTKYGEKEVEYTKASLKDMRALRDELAAQLQSACGIDVTCAGPRIINPVFRRTY